MDPPANPKNILIRKPGISSWMWNNIERMTTSSNFDKYGTSPPDSSGFMAEFEEMAFPEIPSTTEFIARSNSFPQTTKTDQIKEELTKKKKKQKNQALPDQHFARSISTGSLTKHVSENFTGMIPSEDSTPMYTPEGSPLVTRRAASPMEVLCGPKLQEHVDKKRSAGFFSPGFENHKPKIGSPTMGSTKYPVTNFDMNVVSPISW